jgi:hypothetical protein
MELPHPGPLPEGGGNACSTAMCKTERGTCLWKERPFVQHSLKTAGGLARSGPPRKVRWAATLCTLGRDVKRAERRKPAAKVCCKTSRSGRKLAKSRVCNGRPAVDRQEKCKVEAEEDRPVFSAGGSQRIGPRYGPASELLSPPGRGQGHFRRPALRGGARKTGTVPHSFLRPSKSEKRASPRTLHFWVDRRPT